MKKYVEHDIVERIMSAVESADRGIAFFVQNGTCVVYDSALTYSGSDEFDEWFFRDDDTEPTMENLPKELEGAILSVIPYNPREIAE